MKTTFREQLILLFVDHLIKQQGVRTTTVQDINDIIYKVDYALSKNMLAGSKDDVLSESILELKLPTHATNILISHGIETIGDLIACKSSELTRFRGFGFNALHRTITALERLNHKLRE